MKSQVPDPNLALLLSFIIIDGTFYKLNFVLGFLRYLSGRVKLVVPLSVCVCVSDRAGGALNTHSLRRPSAARSEEWPVLLTWQ